jgi:hypothetical protein
VKTQYAPKSMLRMIREKIIEMEEESEDED